MNRYIPQSVTFLMLIIAMGLGLVAFTSGQVMAQPLPDDPKTTPTAGSLRFSIGFLPEGSDIANTSRVMEALRQYLEKNEATATILKRDGYSEIVLSACDSPRDMVQRMNEGEFDLVFATAVVYARQDGRHYGEPILQTHEPDDFFNKQEGYMRRGVVFAGPASALFNPQVELTSEAIHDELARQWLAVPSSDSAAGYILPRLQLSLRYHLESPAGFLFCGSDAEVVKHVVSGLTPVGACREGALRELIPVQDASGYYRVLFETIYYPTDPIVVSNRLYPTRSDLGVALKSALREFFNEVTTLTPGLSVENVTGRGFEKIRSQLTQYQGLKTEQEQPLPGDTVPPPEPATSTPEATPPATPAVPVTTPKPELAVPEILVATPTPSPEPTPAPTPTPTPRPRPVLPVAGAEPATSPQGGAAQ